MSRHITLTALYPWLHGNRVSKADITYTNEWIQETLNEYDKGDQHAVIEGRLVIGHGSAHRWILRAVEDAQARGEPVVITDDEDIFGPPEKLLQIVFKHWGEWQAEGDRWLWKKQTIRDFFKFYNGAIIYIDVY